ncbi:solute carrier family 2, facilitated glucose transporter member 3-like isoform X2 [Ascaphus truei]|uniref:solute carrier family 2, facilitated glucose transporter member 3-like isoform X2 n=1 Tax=Ascaphus truei TaxID=8439 RepID=UPI003F5A09CC
MDAALWGADVTSHAHPALVLDCQYFGPRGHHIVFLCRNAGQSFWRKSILMINLFSLFAVVLMSASKMANYIELLIVGRFVMGLFCGLAMTLIPLYIQEVAPTHLRGAFSTMNQLSYAMGIFIGQVVSLESVLGTDKWWPFMLTMSIVPAILQMLTLPFCPESPRYLFINCQREQEGVQELQRLRGTPDVWGEVGEMKEEAAQLLDAPEVTLCQLFTLPSYKRPIVITFVINCSTQLSGFNALINYSTKIFLGAGVPHAQLTTLGVGIVNILSIIMSVLLVEKTGRRTLLLIGQLTMAFCNILLVISVATMAGLEWMKYVLVFGIFLFVWAFELGPGPIAWYITAELFSQVARPAAMGVTSSWTWFNKFLVAMLYESMRDLIGPYVFLIFASVLLGAALYTWFQVPETKGRTFKDVAAEFHQADPILMNNTNKLEPRQAPRGH